MAAVRHCEASCLLPVQLGTSQFLFLRYESGFCHVGSGAGFFGGPMHAFLRSTQTNPTSVYKWWNRISFTECMPAASMSRQLRVKYTSRVDGKVC